jgi:hypothetical protein
MVDIKKLVKISTYAKTINKSVCWVHKLATAEKISLVIIDGVKFIKVD